nr:FMN-binding negative transcriptional regulator [Ktedonobacteraceae bacterium]
MYIPAHFRENDMSTLQQFIQEYSFGILVTQHEGTPVANHLPFLLDAGRGSQGVLRAHMARGNAQWRMLDETEEVLVIFQGPHSYVSPSWYRDDVEESVPTWNYAAVHAYGRPRLIEDSTELLRILQASIAENEAQFASPWHLEMSDESLQKKLKAIVGFEIEITRLEGKFKLSQNRSAADQRRVIAALDEAMSPDTAELMRQRLDRK